MSEHKINVLERQVTALLDERDKLKDGYWDMHDVVLECRSSVKFDLLHYEKQFLAYGNLGSGGKTMHEAAEAEAKRLHKLLGRIDALAMPNVEVTGLPQCADGSDAKAADCGRSG
jgi:hypothetical protein